MPAAQGGGIEVDVVWHRALEAKTHVHGADGCLEGCESALWERAGEGRYFSSSDSAKTSALPLIPLLKSEKPDLKHTQFFEEKTFSSGSSEHMQKTNRESWSPPGGGVVFLTSKL